MPQFPGRILVSEGQRNRKHVAFFFFFVFYCWLTQHITPSHHDGVNLNPRLRIHLVVCFAKYFNTWSHFSSGLQMVEQYENGRGLTYFKCNLCAAHGKLDTMYHHLIGKKHTVKYIVSIE